MLVSELVDQFGAAEGGGFDLSPQQRLKVANRAIKRFAAMARCIEVITEIGPTVADQADYAIPANMIDLHMLYYGGLTDGARLSTKQLREVAAGNLRLLRDYAFAPYAGAEGGRFVRVYPTPDEDGLSLEGFGVGVPNDLTLEATLPFDEDAIEGLLAAMKKIGYEDVDENVRLAEYHGTQARDAAEEFRRRYNSHVGSGPAQIQLRNVHFR